MKCSTIVVGFDGSDCARRALEAAAELAEGNATVHVVTAYDPPTVSQMNALYGAVPDEFRSQVDFLAIPHANLDEATSFFTAKGIANEGHLVDDDPASAILDVAEKTDADMVVVGSRGLGRASRFVRGSVSARVANHAHTSFMVIQD